MKSGVCKLHLQSTPKTSRKCQYRLAKPNKPKVHIDQTSRLALPTKYCTSVFDFVVFVKGTE